MGEFLLGDIGSMFYPTPKERIEEPVETELQVGDLVKTLIGPAQGNISFVVVERNGNYADKEPYCGDEEIGVGFAEGVELTPELELIVQQLTQAGNLTTVTRWFDSPDQLELLQRAEN